MHMILLQSIMLLVALVITPLLLTLIVFRNRELPFVASATGIIAIVLACGVALALHTTRTPITAISLTAAHLILFCLVSAAAVMHKPQLRVSLTPDEKRLLLPGLALLLVIIFPYTFFTGIDTYKWQDVASSVRVDSSLPWLVHPLSLLGFTPRSYPSAHPILLATIQIMGGLGVDGGFFIISLFNALLGAATAYCLGRRCFRQHSAIAFALLYVLSPVFIRYTHWATGRGLFLALFPAFITLLLALPRAAAWPGALGMALLLLLSHKVALVAIPLLTVTMLLGVLVPRRSNRVAIALCVLPALVAAAALVTPWRLPFPLSQLTGLARYSVTRFAWMVPAAAVGLMVPGNLFENRAIRALFPAILMAIPLAYERHMYGALLALPFVTLMAVTGIESLAQLRPGWTATTGRIVALLAIVGAIGTVVHRSRIATPRDLRQAAMFLEQHDPEGPFRVVAPGRARTQVQAYVSGCPRICVSSSTNLSIRVPSPPPPSGSARETLSAWATYGRGLFSIPELKTSWYGAGSRTYYFVIDKQGTAPTEGSLIYDTADIQIYETGTR